MTSDHIKRIAIGAPIVAALALAGWLYPTGLLIATGVPFLIAFAYGVGWLAQDVWNRRKEQNDDR